MFNNYHDFIVFGALKGKIMFWKKQDTTVKPAPDHRNTIERLYADRRFPNPKTPDFSKFSASELAIAEKCKFLQQYLNIRLFELWTVEMQENHYGTLRTYDMPDRALRYQVWHGDCRVARIELKLGNWNWEKYNSIEIVASLDWAGCFDADQVRNFFLAIASVHDDIFDLDHETKLDAKGLIQNAMTDALWNAFANKKFDELQNMRGNSEIDAIELSFEGDFGGYTRSIEYWKSQDINIFQLEKDRIQKSNERDF